MKLVVVESPAKAKTLESYLGAGYSVVASMGHVRDLREKTDAVQPEAGFKMTWELDSNRKRQIREITKALKGAGALLLATDPDREGEAISWHLVETLREQGALRERIEVQRISFNAVTRAAVEAALRSPREIDGDLVDAYRARRALDFLVGFHLSPVLWRKLPGARSAGRVQSVAVRLIVEREREIETFQPREHWLAFVDLTTATGDSFRARLVRMDGRKVGKFDLPNEDAARRAERVLNEAAGFVVKSVMAKPHRRKPAAPFITSTLQQEASRKLRLTAADTMRASQRLYEDGRITYMRTDGVDMVPEAAAAARALIESEYGREYVPPRSRKYRSQAKNAQEAHECIRPTNLDCSPESLSGVTADQRKLYRLIWERTVASQMADAVLERTTVEIEVLNPAGSSVAGLRASGQVLKFPGFLRLYKEGKDEVPSVDDDENGERRLPPLKEGDRPGREQVRVEQRFTKPPARFSEATLVRQLEELGIGRPSTFATILSVIQARGYAELSQRRLVPTLLGRLATAFLESYFQRYVAYDFTADLEQRLDDISGGRATRMQVLGDFWDGFSTAVGDAKDLSNRAVIDRVEEILEPVLFPARSDGVPPRTCPRCGDGRLGLRTSKNGPFLGCGNYPECKFTRSLDAEAADWPGDRDLGSGEGGAQVLVRRGPYGFYLQVSSISQDKPPKRASLPEGVDPFEIDRELALRYLALPRALGVHPETGKTVYAGIGRYGPYVRHEKTYVNVPKDESVLEVGFNRAIDLLATRTERRARSWAGRAIRELGEHPDGGPVAILEGRYGPYVKWGKVNASLPRNREPADVDMAEAMDLLVERQRKKASGARSGASGRAAPKARRAATRRAATRKREE